MAYGSASDGLVRQRVSLHAWVAIRPSNRIWRELWRWRSGSPVMPTAEQGVTKAAIPPKKYFIGLATIAYSSFLEDLRFELPPLEQNGN